MLEENTGESYQSIKVLSSKKKNKQENIDRSNYITISKFYMENNKASIIIVI